jgi:hypothetical protein
MRIATYYINNIPVYIRDLPSGDIAVWHPYDIALGKVIYQICFGKGYWNTKYKNWLIFSGFANVVIGDIEARGSHHAK